VRSTVPSTLKHVLVTIAGVLIGSIVISAIEALSHWIMPLPGGIDYKDPAQLAVYMDQVPLAAKLSVVFAWGAGMFAGATAAVLMSGRRRWPATAVVLVLLAATGVNFAMIPHPAWMMVAAVLVAGVAWCGASWFSKPTSGAKAAE